MKIKLTLAALAIISTGIGAASGQEMTIEQYTGYLIDTYGKDATVTDALINGKNKDGAEFTDMQPVLEATTRILSPGLQIPGPACTTVHEKVPPTAQTAYKWYWCAQRRTVNGRQYEAQRDYMKYANGSYSYTYISQLLDCDMPADKDLIRTTTTTILALACP